MEKKIIDATISEYKEVLTSSRHWSPVTRMIEDFFDGQPFSSISMTMAPYQHNICQWAMLKYFSSCGFEKIKDLDYDDEIVSSAVLEPIEYDYEKSFWGTGLLMFSMRIRRQSSGLW